jgi:hypothetical protein
MSLRKGPIPLSAKVLFWLIGFPLVLTIYSWLWLFLFILTFGVEPPRDRRRQPRDQLASSSQAIVKSHEGKLREGPSAGLGS